MSDTLPTDGRGTPPEAIPAPESKRLSSVPPVFIVGRFRSGGTALWHVLRQNPQAFAIYEPLHGALMAHLDSHVPPDETHLGVTDYFTELRPHRDQIWKRYRQEFSHAQLALGGADDHPSLKQYLDYLVALAAERTALVKFVRMDYRLPWLRKQYPDAKILYIARGPRDAWISAAKNRIHDYLSDPRVSQYNEALFAAGLLQVLPELGESQSGSSYERSYYLWKLSRALGETYADLVIDFDDAAKDPAPVFEAIGRLTGISTTRDTLDRSWHRGKGAKWPTYADRVDFDAIERHCDHVLRRRGLLSAIERRDLDVRWPVVDPIPARIVVAAVEALGHRYIELEESFIRQLGIQFRLDAELQAKMLQLASELNQAYQRLLEAETSNHTLIREVQRLQGLLQEAEFLRRALADSEAREAALHAELNTTGVRLGRWLVRQRHRIGPAGTLRGKAIALMVKAARTAKQEGPGALIKKTLRFVLRRLRPW